MIEIARSALRAASAAAAFALFSIAVYAQTALPAAAHTASGLVLSTPSLTLRVDALRPGVLRVRIFPLGQPAEDASWAVLPAARTARVSVVSEPAGFRTSALRVAVTSDLRLTISDLLGNVLQTDALPVAWSSDGFKITKHKTDEDHFFGLGDKTGPLDRVGEDFTMWNTDSWGAQESTDPIYKSIPFFLEMHSGRTIGVLLDNTYRTFFDFGRERTDRYTFSAPAGPLDYYFLYGPEPKQVVESYAWLTGPTPLPPLWALGFQQSRYSYFPRAQLEEVAARLRADKIPSDALYLDIDYQYKNRPFTVDTQAFPDFPGLIKQMTAEHFHTVLITDLHIADLPNQGYAPYDSGEAGDHFVKENGKDYVGPVWPGPSVFPDFTQQQTRQWWGTLYKDFVADGVAGFWNDMNEPAVFRYPSKTMPDDVVHRIDEPGFATRTAMHPEIHNIYGMQNSRATWDGMLTLRPNDRPFVLTRASYAGGQRYAATWTGDNLATWAALRQTTPQLLNLGLSGFAFSGADVGGFGGSPSPDLLTKWIMLAAFQPLDRDHASKGTRPHEVWVDGPVHEAIRKRYIEERYRLMPYLYTTAEETSRTGLPITRPLFLEFPHATLDNHPLDDDGAGEFMFGPSILVAASPLPDDIAAYEVHLPPVIWYDYWTGARLDRRAPVGSRDLELRGPLDQDPKALPNVMADPKLGDLPVYVRAGAIIPMQPLVQYTGETPDGPLTLRVFPSAAGDPCGGDLYTDDGQTYDFRKGAYLRLHIACSVASDGALTVIIPAREGSFKPWWSAFRIEAVGFTPRDSQATIKAHNTPLEQTSLGWAVTLPDTGKPQTITLH
jgi:alpha-glucosidase